MLGVCPLRREGRDLSREKQTRGDLGLALTSSPKLDLNDGYSSFAPTEEHDKTPDNLEFPRLLPRRTYLPMIHRPLDINCCPRDSLACPRFRWRLNFSMSDYSCSFFATQKRSEVVAEKSSPLHGRNYKTNKFITLILGSECCSLAWL